MKRVIVVPAVLDGAPLKELKDWLAIRTDAEDALLERHLRAALELCERFTGVMPLLQVCDEVVPASRGWTRLSATPVTALVDARRLTLDGAQPTLDEADFELAIDAGGDGRLRLRRDVAEQRLAVRYSAGLASDWLQLDAGLRHGIVRMAAHCHLERRADGGGTPPASVVALWQPFRRLRLR